MESRTELYSVKHTLRAVDCLGVSVVKPMFGAISLLKLT